jgi:hypothetical protein
MPPQQLDGLLDVVDMGESFRLHGVVLSGFWKEEKVKAKKMLILTY